MNSTELRDHVFTTYINVRYGMAALALSFPIVLYVVGLASGVGLENSLSHYYYSAPPDYPARTWFVGVLFTLGAFLYLYKGYSNTENNLLNCAGTCAWAVALIPTSTGQSNLAEKFTVHGAAAVLLFLCVAAVCIFCADKTLGLITDKNRMATFRAFYRTCGGVMVVSPLAAWALTLTNQGKFIFVVEAIGTSAFGLYWWRKSVELAQTQAELLANRGELNLTVPRHATPKKED